MVVQIELALGQPLAQVVLQRDALLHLLVHRAHRIEHLGKVALGRPANRFDRLPIDEPSRQRHRVFRKFKYISDQTGQPWCVGCGRCTAYCTAGISIVNIVNRLIGDTERVGAPV